MIWKKKLVKYTFMLANLAFILVMIEVFGLKSLLYYFIFIIGLAMFRLYKQRRSFFMIMDYVETCIWGKPLKKDLWDKGELKNKKVKIMWKDKSKGGKKNDKEKSKQDKVSR